MVKCYLKLNEIHQKKAHRKNFFKGAVLVISFNTLFMIDESIHGVHGVNLLIYPFFF